MFKTTGPDKFLTEENSEKEGISKTNIFSRYEKSP